MRVWRSILLSCAGFLLSLPTWAQHNETISGHAAAANEVLVKLRAGVSLQADSYIVRAHDIRRVHALNRRGLVHLRSGSETAAQLVAQLSADPDVEYAEPNYVLHTTAAPASVVPDDPLFLQQWALQNTGQTGGTAHADIDATQAWSITTGTATVVVGVVDTGLDYTHPDLQANIWSAPAAYTVQFAPGDSITCPAGSHGYDALNNVCDPMDQNDHGTHVSGIIGAVGDNSTGVSGINWKASIMGLRFLDASGSGTVAGAVRAIEFALQAKVVLGSQANLQVLSNSWGGTGFSQALLDEIDDANAAGMLFVMAAGNNSASLDTTTFYPASYRTPNAITVAATDGNDALASFSNYGKGSVDLGAPGVQYRLHDSRRELRDHERHLDGDAHGVGGRGVGAGGLPAHHGAVAGGAGEQCRCGGRAGQYDHLGRAAQRLQGAGLLRAGHDSGAGLHAERAFGGGGADRGRGQRVDDHRGRRHGRLQRCDRTGRHGPAARGERQTHARQHRSWRHGLTGADGRLDGRRGHDPSHDHGHQREA